MTVSQSGKAKSKAKPRKTADSPSVRSPSPLTPTPDDSQKYEDRIFETLATFLSQKDLKSMCLATRQTYRAATRVLYREIGDHRLGKEFQGTRCMRLDKFVRTILSNSVLASYVETLVLRTYRSELNYVWEPRHLADQLKSMDAELDARLASPPKIDDPYFTPDHVKPHSLFPWTNLTDRDVLMAIVIAYAPNLKHLHLNMLPKFSQWTVLPNMMASYCSGALPIDGQPSLKLSKLSITQALVEIEMRDFVYSWLNLSTIHTFETTFLQKSKLKPQFSHIRNFKVHGVTDRQLLQCSDLVSALASFPLLKVFSLVSVDLRFDGNNSWESLKRVFPSTLRELNIWDMRYKGSSESGYRGQPLGSLQDHPQILTLCLDATLLFGGKVAAQVVGSGYVSTSLPAMPMTDNMLQVILPAQLVRLEIRTRCGDNLLSAVCLGSIFRIKQANIRPHWSALRVRCVHGGIRACTNEESTECRRWYELIMNQHLANFGQVGVSLRVG